MKDWQRKLLARILRAASQLENALTKSELLQVDATLIAGTLIFLTISLTSLDPSASMQVPQLDAGGLPIDLQLLILEYNLQATDELTITANNARSAETYFRITVAASVILPLSVSAILSLFGLKFQAAVFLIMGLIMIIVVMLAMANLGLSFRNEARNTTQIGSDELENKLQAIRDHVADLRTNSTATQ